MDITYDTAKQRYLAAKALGDWGQAESWVEALIMLRPCDEALPLLAEWLREARRERRWQESPWRRLAEGLSKGKVAAR